MIQRNFIIGEEWVYMKLYSGPRTIENVLVDLYPVILGLLSKRLIDSFFFIRYTDPSYHIRLRLHCTHTKNFDAILSRLAQSLKGYLDHFIISKIMIDTYKREIERYGEKNIFKVEEIFYQDSNFILKFLKKCGQIEDDKWKISTLFINCILENNKYSIEEKIAFTETCSSMYYEEFYGKEPAFRKVLNNRYRYYRHEIESILECDLRHNWWMKEVIRYTSVIQFEEKESRFVLLSSIIHMHVNRLFRTKQRFVEFVLYYYLRKYYMSKKSQSQYNR